MEQINVLLYWSLATFDVDLHDCVVQGHGGVYQWMYNFTDRT